MVTLTLYDLTSDFDIFLASHKDKDITLGQREMNLEDLLDSTVNIVFTGRLRMEYFDGKGATRNGIRWGISVERGKLVALLNKHLAM